jgi:hypothetical protein
MSPWVMAPHSTERPAPPPAAGCPNIPPAGRSPPPQPQRPDAACQSSPFSSRPEASTCSDAVARLPHRLNDFRTLRSPVVEASTTQRRWMLRSTAQLGYRLRSELGDMYAHRVNGCASRQRAKSRIPASMTAWARAVGSRSHTDAWLSSPCRQCRATPACRRARRFRMGRIDAGVSASARPRLFALGLRMNLFCLNEKDS